MLLQVCCSVGLRGGSLLPGGLPRNPKENKREEWNGVGLPQQASIQLQLAVPGASRNKEVVGVGGVKDRFILKTAFA